MNRAAKHKPRSSLFGPLGLFLLLALALFAPQNRVWAFSVSAVPGVGSIAAASPTFVGENYDPFRYDPSGYTVAPNTTVWSKNPLTRGSDIESTLARTDYKDWFNVGQLDKGKFPLVDFQRGNNLVSLKSVDTTGSRWMKSMQDHIRDLGTRGATVGGNPASMILDLRVQPGGAQAASSLGEFGKKFGVNVVIKEFP